MPNGKNKKKNSHKIIIEQKPNLKKNDHAVFNQIIIVLHALVLFCVWQLKKAI